MINLLPKKDKENYRRREAEKLITIFGAIFAVSLVCFSLMLVLVSFYTERELEEKIDRHEGFMSKYEDRDIEELQDKLTIYNKKLLKVRDFYKKRTEFTEGVEMITQIMPDGVRLQNLSLKKEDQSIIFAMSATSETRDVLLDLRNKLESKKTVDDLNFSPGAWIRENDISFQLTFRFKNE